APAAERVALAALPGHRRRAQARAVVPRPRGARTARARLRPGSRRPVRRGDADGRADPLAASRTHALPPRRRASRERGRRATKPRRPAARPEQSIALLGALRNEL